jgi:hypothetical protein
MRGNEIIVSTEPQGRMEGGYVAAGETHYPGMIVQRDPTVALQLGRHTYKYYDRAADGDKPAGAFWLVTNMENALLGKDATEPYAPGEEYNLLVANFAGTADDHAAGEILMVDDGTGKLVATTGTPATEVAQLLEAITDPTADTLAWCQWAGN